jgi:hypothetical protein
MAEFPGIPYAGPAAARYGSYSKRYMVVHCTANNASPANEAAYARRRTDGVGMHFCSDPNTVLQVLESWYGTGHVGSAVGNRYGISWEFVGFLSSSPEYYRQCVNRAADAMRMVMARWGIPHQWLTDAQLRDGRTRGLVTHLQCSRVLGGSNHTDPGPNFPQQYLIDALNGGHMDHWQDPTVRTQAQRIDAMRGMAADYVVDYGSGPVRETNELGNILRRLEEAAAADEARDRAILAAVEALAAGGGADTSSIVEAIQAVRDQTTATVTALRAEVDDLRATVNDRDTEINQLKAALGQAQLIMGDAPDTTDHE